MISYKRKRCYEQECPEYKFHDVDLDDAVIGAGGNITASINLIPQGVAENKRIGRKCTIRSINWSWRINLNQVEQTDSPPSGDTVRVILYLDQQCNGATIAVTDLLETDDYQSFMNLANSGRFIVLLDEFLTLNYPCMTEGTADQFSVSNVLQMGHFSTRCNIPLEFDFSNGILPEIKSNNLGVMLVGSQGVANWNSNFRLRFTDQ